MSDEYLDVVDENDRVIGRDTRKNVHDHYQIHRGVHVFVVNERGWILVQRRSLLKDYYPGYLDVSVGGQVISGETYEEAGCRELREELGCHDGPISFIGAYDAFSSRQREKRQVFVHRCAGPFTLDFREVAGVEFYSMERVSQLLQVARFTEGFRRSLAIFTCESRRWGGVISE